MPVTMKEIDALRAMADFRIDTLRNLVRHRDENISARDALVNCPASTAEEIALAALRVNHAETAIALAETSKEEAEKAVLAALREWWIQGCRPPNAVEEGLDALIETVKHAGGEGRGHPSVDQAHDAVLMLLGEAIRSASPLVITIAKTTAEAP